MAHSKWISLPFFYVCFVDWKKNNNNNIHIDLDKNTPNKSFTLLIMFSLLKVIALQIENTLKWEKRALALKTGERFSKEKRRYQKDGKGKEVEKRIIKTSQ